jgi:hypothetical protein
LVFALKEIIEGGIMNPIGIEMAPCGNNYGNFLRDFLKGSDRVLLSWLPSNRFPLSLRCQKPLTPCGIRLCFGGLGIKKGFVWMVFFCKDSLCCKRVCFGTLGAIPVFEWLGGVMYWV